MKKYIYLFLLIFSISFQGMGNNVEKKSGECHNYHYVAESFKYEGIQKEKNSKSAKDIIHNIVNVVGLKPNFEIRAADISNAAAVNYGGKRFILYDPAFMNRIQNATQTDWAAISILAHEIGHHLNGHTTMAKGGNPALELEADEFSGFVLRKMGATLEESQKAMKLISNERGSSTHPKRSLRLSAIARGYNSADEQLLAAAHIVNPTQKEIPVNDDIIVAKTNYELDKSNILREVHFNNMPERKFFLTKKLDLIEVTSDGIEVLGDIAKTSNDRLELNIYDDHNNIKLKISSKGLLYNSNNAVVGYLKTPIA